jgi:hypothetical protein
MENEEYDMHEDLYPEENRKAYVQHFENQETWAEQNWLDSNEDTMYKYDTPSSVNRIQTSGVTNKLEIQDAEAKRTASGENDL